MRLNGQNDLHRGTERRRFPASAPRKPAPCLSDVRFVVRSQPRPVIVVELHGIELRRVLDLILRQADEDRLIIDVDPLNRPGRYSDLSTENPRTGIYDKVSAAGLLRSLIDLPDRT